MRLDKGHLNQFENISPPMVEALTLPIEGLKGGDNVVIYVCIPAFAKGSKASVLEVAKALCLRPDSLKTLTDPDLVGNLLRAIDIIMHAPGGHQDVADSLMSATNNLKVAIDEAREALIGDSNDSEHDALVSIMEVLGETIPERE